MARDYAEIERQFIAELKSETGRDLAEWMAAIGATTLADKNAIIDWLRFQGLHFNPASKLERLHANGGLPFYGDAEPRLPCAAAETKAQPRAAPLAITAARQDAVLTETRRPVQPDPSGQADLAPVLAAAKGYRPLAVMLLKGTWQAVPDLVARPAGDHIELSRARTFAAIEPRARNVRMALDLGERPFDATWVSAQIRGAPVHLTHMLTLTDARLVNAELLGLIAASAERQG